MFVRIATERCLPGKGPEFEAIAPKIPIPAMLSQKGIISVEFMKCVDEPDAYCIISKWESREAMERYRQSPEFKDSLEKVRHLFAQLPVIHHYEPITG